MSQDQARELTRQGCGGIVRRMGMGVYDLRGLIALHGAGVLGRATRVAEIGAQELNADAGTYATMVALGQAFGAGPCPLLAGEHHRARAMWEWLGLESVAIDIDGSPGAIALDLNVDQAPTELAGRFGLVTNYGTTEHVANQVNAFKLIHDLTAPGGVMVHNLPAQGFVIHGLVSYSPKFFWALARSNAYGWLHQDFLLGQPTSLPSHLIDQIAIYDPDFAKRIASYRPTDAAVAAVLRKDHDWPLVPPLDVPANAPPAPALAGRYGPAFSPWTLRRRRIASRLRRLLRSCV